MKLLFLFLSFLLFINTEAQQKLSIDKEYAETAKSVEIYPIISAPGEAIFYVPYGTKIPNEVIFISVYHDIHDDTMTFFWIESKDDLEYFIKDDIKKFETFFNAEFPYKWKTKNFKDLKLTIDMINSFLYNAKYPNKAAYLWDKGLDFLNR